MKTTTSRSDTIKPMDEDAELITQHDTGDTAAFDTLVKRALPQVWRFARRMVGSDDEAEDVVQETFVKAWRYLPRFERGKNFRTWVLSIARNTAIDMLRKKRGITLSRFDDDEGGNVLIDTLADDELLPDELAVRAENAETLERVIVQLPDPAREIILLRYQEGLTFEEIAESIGEPLNTVKSRGRRALVALKKLLEKIAPKGDTTAYTQ